MASTTSTIAKTGLREPMDIVKFNIDEIVLVKLKGEHEIVGRLHAFDQHMNMVLGDVREKRRILESGNSSSTENLPLPMKGGLEWKTVERERGMLYVRGDAVIIVVKQ